MQEFLYTVEFDLLPYTRPDCPIQQQQEQITLRNSIEMQLQSAFELLPKPGRYAATKSAYAGLALWFRSVESCRATLMLLDHGMLSSSLATLRTAYECLFFARALWEFPDFFDVWTKWQVEELEKQGALVRKDAYDELSPADQRFFDSLGSSDKATAGGPVFRAAKKAGMVPIYQTIYRTLSSVGTHATQLSVRPYLSAETLGIWPDMKDAPFYLDAIGYCLTAGSRTLEVLLNDQTQIQPSPR